MKKARRLSDLGIADIVEAFGDQGIQRIGEFAILLGRKVFSVKIPGWHLAGDHCQMFATRSDGDADEWEHAESAAAMMGRKWNPQAISRCMLDAFHPCGDRANAISLYDLEVQVDEDDSLVADFIWQEQQRVELTPGVYINCERLHVAVGSLRGDVIDVDTAGPEKVIRLRGDNHGHVALIMPLYPIASLADLKG